MVGQSIRQKQTNQRTRQGGFFEGFDFLPTSADVEVESTILAQREFSRLTLKARRQAERWTVKVKSDQVQGNLSFALGSSFSPAEISATFSRFELPNPINRESMQSTPVGRQAGRLSWLPEVKFQADQFIIGDAALGELTVAARNQSDAWRIDELRLTHPAAKLLASGTWRHDQVRNSGITSLNLDLDIADSGAFLSDLGMPGVIRDAPGKIAGQLSWQGLPTEPDISSFAGSLNIAFRQGQFLKADPGFAKLISVLSLQAVSRRLRLDFSDLFDDGLAFDAIAGVANFEGGVLTMEPLLLQGVQAEVVMSGSADIQQQTQDLNVKIEPHINAGLASLAYAAFVNPAVGIAGLLAQWALEKPLKSVFGFEYQVTGPWSNPSVKQLGQPAPESHPDFGY